MPRGGAGAAGTGAGADSRRLVSESAFEYLLAEMVSLAGEADYGAGQASADGARKESRLEQSGFEVGFRFTERCARRRGAGGGEHGDSSGSGGAGVLSRDPLEVVKFLCKDLWGELFDKQIDKLETNHRGFFVLTDQSFRWIADYCPRDTTTSSAREEGPHTPREIATRLLQFPCGLLRGALANLAITAVVDVDFEAMPECKFRIRIKS